MNRMEMKDVSGKVIVVCESLVEKESYSCSRIENGMIRRDLWSGVIGFSLGVIIVLVVIFIYLYGVYRKLGER